MFTQNASVPQHIYGCVRNDILHGLSGVKGYEPCIITGITSVPGRAFYFSILCESGAQWARIPIHFLHHAEPSGDREWFWQAHDLQLWDAMGWEFSIVQYTYFREMACTFRTRGGQDIPARYWFTLDHTDNGFSLCPSQHKCFHILLLDDESGQIAAMPNNRIVWNDPSFCRGELPRYKVMADKTWHCERQELENPQHTAITQDA